MDLIWARVPAVTSQPLRYTPVVRTSPLSVLTEAIGTIVTKSSCPRRRPTVRVCRGVNALTVTVGVVLVIVQRRNVEISGFVYNDFGNAAIERNRPLRAHPPRLGDRSDRRFVGTPDQDGEYLMRVRLVEIDECRGSVLVGRSILAGDHAANGCRFAYVIFGFHRRQNLSLCD